MAFIVGIASIGLTEAAASGSDMEILTPNDTVPSSYKVISESTVYDTKTLDMWHFSAGYWEVGNAGSNKIRITDNEFQDSYSGQISPSDTASFNFTLPASVRNEISAGNKIAARINTTGGVGFNELFSAGSMSTSVSGNQLNISTRRAHRQKRF